MQEICGKIGGNRTSVLNGIPYRILKLIVETRPKPFSNILEECLKNEIFPAQLKKHFKFMLLPKLNKPPENPASHRPICLLYRMGKLMETFI